MAQLYGRQPEDMKHLTPSELESLVASTAATVRASQTPPGGRKR